MREGQVKAERQLCFKPYSKNPIYEILEGAMETEHARDIETLLVERDRSR